MREDDFLIRGNNTSGKVNKTDSAPHRTIYIGLVVDNNDPNDAHRLKVRIPGLDDNIDITNDTNSWCNFLGYKGNATIPKVNESVFVILSDVTKPYFNRFWIGPVISDFQNIDFDPYISSLTYTNGGIFKGNQPISTLPDSDTVFPVSEDEINNVKLIGRNNADIQLSDNKFKIRNCYYNKETFKLNTTNPSFIEGGLNIDTNQTYQVLHSDLLVLLSRVEDSGKVTNNNHSITNDDIANIIENGYSTLRAEPLIELLKKLIVFLCVEHVHPYGGKGPVNKIDSAQELLNFDFDSVVNKGIKVN